MEPSDKLQRLIGFIQQQTGADTVEVQVFQRLSGGAIQENHGLRVLLHGGSMAGPQAFVVRCDAPSVLAVSLSRAQEFRVLQAACEAGMAVPRPYWLCTDKSLLGSEFYVMQWAAGSASPRSLVKDALPPAQRQALAFRLGQELARLHKVHPPQAALSFLALPDQPPSQRRITEYRSSLDALGQPQPVLEYLLSWLQQHAPQDQGYVLCHGDFRTGNYLVQDGRLTAVLDWEFAAWSDPYEDLGWLCARSWRFGSPEREVGGVGDKTDLFRGYADISGRAPDPGLVAYWEVMASVRWAVIALMQAHRHLSGQEESLELVLTGCMATEIQQDGLDHLRGADPALAAQAGLPNQAEDQALTALQLAAATHPRLPPDDSPPHGTQLLDAARRVLLDLILPALPKERHYDARMTANAMAIAARDISHGAWVETQAQAAIGQFYNQMGLPAPFPGQAAAALARDIRADLFPDSAQTRLLTLAWQLTQLALRVNNPKRLNTTA